MLSRHSVGTYQENELTRNSALNARPKSSQLAEPLWTEPGLKSGIGVRERISICQKKKKKKRSGIRFVGPFPTSLTCEEKASTTTALFDVCFFLASAR